MASTEYNNIVNNIYNVNELAELENINRVLVTRIKEFRGRKAQNMRYTLRSGNKVSWNGKYGYSTGIVRKVKRKNAEVVADRSGTVWNIPMNMLEVIDG